MTLSGATTPSQSGPWSVSSEGVLRIPQSFSITENSLSDCLVSFSRNSFRESYPSSEMQVVYSAALADWAIQLWVNSRAVWGL